MPHILLLVQICLLYSIILTTNLISQNPALSMFRIYGKISKWKSLKNPLILRKMHHRRMDREIDWQMNRTDFIGSIPRRWRFNHVFLEFDNKFFLGYLAWLWAITEIINTRKRNTINIVQGSKSLKTMILSKFTSHNFHISWMFQIHSYIIDFQFFLLSWERTW